MSTAAMKQAAMNIDVRVRRRGKPVEGVRRIVRNLASANMPVSAAVKAQI
jgi:hypothetical protein